MFFFMVAGILVLGGLAWWSAREYNRMSEAERQMAQLNSDLDVIISVSGSDAQD